MLPRILSFRSNLAEISIFEDGEKWAIAFDERAFDYIALQIGLIGRPWTASAPALSRFYFLACVAENIVDETPLHALSVLIYMDRNKPKVAVPDSLDSKHGLELLSCFRIIRTFILAHEIGHIAVKNQSHRDRENRTLSELMKLYSTKKLQKKLKQYARPEKTYIRDMETFLDDVSAEAANSDTQEEILADLFAVRSVIEIELGRLTEGSPRSLPRRVAKAIRSVTQALELLFHITAAVNGVQELFRLKSINGRFPISKFQSVNHLTARNDIRSRLCAAYTAVHHGKAVYDLAHRMPTKLCDLYESTQLAEYNRLVGNEALRLWLVEQTEALGKKITAEEARAQVLDAFHYT